MPVFCVLFLSFLLGSRPSIVLGGQMLRFSVLHQGLPLQALADWRLRQGIPVPKVIAPNQNVFFCCCMFDVCFLCLYDIHISIYIRIYIYICIYVYMYLCIYIFPGPSSDFILRHRTKNEKDILNIFGNTHAHIQTRQPSRCIGLWYLRVFSRGAKSKSNQAVSF